MLGLCIKEEIELLYTSLWFIACSPDWCAAQQAFKVLRKPGTFQGQHALKHVKGRSCRLHL
jgi:hypothetical protein